MALKVTKDYDSNKDSIIITRTDDTTEYEISINHIVSDWKGDDTIKEIEIGDGVRIIEESAFENCKNLTKVTLPESVEIICSNAFAGCTALKEVVTPKCLDGVERVKHYGDQSVMVRYSSLPVNELIEGHKFWLIYDDPRRWE